jgi:hypothetical protein
MGQSNANNCRDVPSHSAVPALLRPDNESDLFLGTSTPFWLYRFDVKNMPLICDRATRAVLRLLGAMTPDALIHRRASEGSR